MSPRPRMQLDGLIAEVAQYCGIGEDKLRDILETRYGRSRIKSLVRAMLRVFRPSKEHNNAGMRVGGRHIEPRIVSEVPGDAQMLGFDAPPLPEG